MRPQKKTNLRQLADRVLRLLVRDSKAPIFRLSNQNYGRPSGLLGSSVGAIGTAFLSLEVLKSDPVPNAGGLDFVTLAERGIVKLKQVEYPSFKVHIPYVFVSASLRERPRSDPLKLWKELVLGEDFYWQQWETFNCNYFAFRLSLYSYLNFKTLPLGSFFTGSKSNLPSDLNLVIPPMEAIAVIKVGNRVPDSPVDIKSNTFVLNANGDPFDAFVFLDTVDKKRILVAFQMKFSGYDTIDPPKAENKSIISEYEKVKNARDKFLPGMEFVLVFLFHRGKARDFKDADIPPGCIVYTKEEQRDLYGELYYHRLEKL